MMNNETRSHASPRTLVVALFTGIMCVSLIACEDDPPGILTPGPRTGAGEGTTGASLYTYHCAACHGLDGRPLVRATEDLLDYEPTLDSFNVILDAGPGLMPSYAHFDNERRQKIYDYVRTFKR